MPHPYCMYNLHFARCHGPIRSTPGSGAQPRLRFRPFPLLVPVMRVAASAQGRANQAHRPHWGVLSAVSVTQTRPLTAHRKLQPIDKQGLQGVHPENAFGGVLQGPSTLEHSRTSVPAQLWVSALWHMHFCVAAYVFDSSTWRPMEAK